MIMIITVISTLLEYTWDIEVWYNDNLPTLFNGFVYGMVVTPNLAKAMERGVVCNDSNYRNLGGKYGNDVACSILHIRYLLARLTY